MNFGQALPEERWILLVRHAYERGIRTFITADVYGAGAADDLLGRALDGLPRQSYCLVGAVGHDFYKGRRQGARGFPRFTDPALRQPAEYHGYLRMAAEKSLERCRAQNFDLLLLHNPDSTGYGSDRVLVRAGQNQGGEIGRPHRHRSRPGQRVHSGPDSLSGTVWAVARLGHDHSQSS